MSALGGMFNCCTALSKTSVSDPPPSPEVRSPPDLYVVHTICIDGVHSVRISTKSHFLSE